MIQRLLQFIVELARELSDETAYSRHLEYVKRPHSAEEWRIFFDSRQKRKYQNGKCC